MKNKRFCKDISDNDFFNIRFENVEHGLVPSAAEEIIGLSNCKTDFCYIIDGEDVGYLIYFNLPVNKQEAYL